MELKPEEFTYFDSHVHLYPERLFRAVREWFGLHSDWQIRYSTQTDEIIDFLTSARVKRFFFFNYAHKPNMSAALNLWNYNIAMRYPQAIALGTVHPGDDDPSAIARQCLEEYRFPGFKIHIEVQRFSPMDERMFPVYEQVLALGRFIVMHVGRGIWANEYCGADSFSALMRRYPDLKVVVAHMGLCETERFFELMSEYKGICLDTAMAFGPRFGHTQRYDPELILLNCERILYGSDFPNLPYDYDEDRRALLALGLPPRVYEQIFYNNAAALLDSAFRLDS